MNPTHAPNTDSKDEQDGYQLEVHEVAELLGVTRTRVSQLTSSGQLSFERRRVGTRNRLFYRRSEVLLHQRSFYGRHLGHAITGGFHGASANSSSAHSAEHTRKGARTEFSHDGLSWSADDLHRSEKNPPNAEISQFSSLHKTILELFNKFQSNISQTIRQQSLSASALQAETDKSDLIQQLMQKTAELSAELANQRWLITQLNVETHALKKDLFQILQHQEKNFRALRLGSMQRTAEPTMPADSAREISQTDENDRSDQVPNRLKISGRAAPRSRPVPLRKILRTK